MNKVLLKISYIGTEFAGFQKQKDQMTVQGEIEKALQLILAEPTTLYGCSRTDAGVHALVYFASFSTNSNFDVKKYPQAINANIHKDISVVEAKLVHEEFHPRFDPIYKEYIYNIWTSKSRNPFLEKIAYHHPQPLDTDKFCALAPLFEGAYDFAAFMSSGSDVKDTNRTIYYCKAEFNGGLLRLKIRGDGFLYNMVRIIVGTLLEASKKQEAVDIVGIINSLDRTKAGPVAPAKGLLLSDVFYGKIKEHNNEGSESINVTYKVMQNS